MDLSLENMEPARKKEKMTNVPANLTENERKIQKDRANRYGDSKIQHGNLGLIWTGILRQAGYVIEPPIPSHIVLLMMVGSKVSRASFEKKLRDTENYDDGKIYFELAKEAKQYADET